MLGKFAQMKKTLFLCTRFRLKYVGSEQKVTYKRAGNSGPASWIMKDGFREWKMVFEWKNDSEKFFKKKFAKNLEIKKSCLTFAPLAALKIQEVESDWKKFFEVFEQLSFCPLFLRAISKQYLWDSSERYKQKTLYFYNGEFDPGSGWTLAAGLTHASRGAAEFGACTE